MKKPTIVMALLVIMAAASVQAADVTFCVAESGNKNTTYFNLATVKTRLICDFYGPNVRPTLPQLYKDGWHLIQVMDGTMIRSDGKNQYRAPIYYLDREKAPKRKKGTSPFFGD